MSSALTSGRLLAALLGLAAGLQVVLAAWTFLPALRQVPADLARMAADPPPEGLTESMLAFRALPPLLRRVPDDETVLVVSTLVAVQLEYHVLPRPMRLLQALPAHWVELARQHAPAIADEVERRRERLDARGLLLTQARLEAALRDVRHVVLAGPEPAEMAAVRSRLEPIAGSGGFTLFAVR